MQPMNSTDREDRRLEHPMFRIEQQQAELFDRPRPELRQQIGGGFARRAQLDPRARRVRQRPPAQFHGGQDLGRLRPSDPGDP
jgi:hypothetical protein